MLDDLRRSTETANEEPELLDSNFSLPADIGPERRILGMTAVERMFLAAFLFLNVLVIGLALLLATGRVVF
jgi:hypothetical protein